MQEPDAGKGGGVGARISTRADMFRRMYALLRPAR